jgi:hypothetical protein
MEMKAKALAACEIRGTTRYEGHKSQVYIDRGEVNRDRGDWPAAVSDYQYAIAISTKIDNFRGVTDAGGLLAAAYLHIGDLRDALAAIDANTRTPDEVYLVPRASSPNSPRGA